MKTFNSINLVVSILIIQILIITVHSLNETNSNNLIDKLIRFKRSQFKRNRFEKSIDESAMLSNEINTIDFCLNGNNCFLKQPFQMKKINLLKFGEINLLQSIDCPCIGQYKHQCGPDLCVKNESSCDDLIHLKNKRKSFDKSNQSIKSCNNSNMTIKTNLFNFRLRF